MTANTFASTFYFFANAVANAKKNKKSLQANAPRHRTMDRHGTTEKEQRTANSTLPKVAVQCFVGQFCGYINFSASYEILCGKSPPSASCKPLWVNFYKFAK